MTVQEVSGLVAWLCGAVAGLIPLMVAGWVLRERKGRRAAKRYPGRLSLGDGYRWDGERWARRR